MPKPTIGQSSWGQTLNDHLDTLQFYRLAVGTGFDPTGTTDSTAALQALVNELANDKGGTIVIPPDATYRIDGQITIPRTLPGQAAGGQGQRSLRITGGGYSQANIQVDDGGSTLDLRYADGPGILTLGQGQLEIDHLNIVNRGTGNAPFIKTTMTTLRIHDVSFVGNQANSGKSTLQDAIILGGTPADLTGGYVYTDTENDPFAGYGTTIERCNFSRIRRGIYTGAWVNSVVISELATDALCGGDSTVAFIDIRCTTAPGDEVRGNVIQNCLIQANQYDVSIAFRGGAANNVVKGCSFWDASSGTFVADVYCDATSGSNWITFDAEEDRFVEDTAGTNMVWKRRSFHGYYTFQNTYAPATALVVKGAPGQTGALQAWQNSDATSTYAELSEFSGGTWLELSTGGPTGIGHGGKGQNPWIARASGAGAYLGDANTGNIISKGGSRFLVGVTGGTNSVFAADAEGIQILAGPRISVGSGSPEGVVTATQGSLWIRTDAAAGAGLYQKTTAGGNTGWVAL